MTTTVLPPLASSPARCVASVVLPTPPFWLSRATIMGESPRACGNACRMDSAPRWHVAPVVHWIGMCRSEEHTSELQSLMRISYAVFCLKKKKHKQKTQTDTKQ